MKRLKPNFEIYDFNGSFLVRYVRPQETGARRHMAESMEDALTFIQSFYEKRREQKVVQFKKSDAEKPRHPYDRDDEWWENNVLEKKMDITFQSDIEENDDGKTDS